LGRHTEEAHHSFYGLSHIGSRHYACDRQALAAMICPRRQKKNGSTHCFRAESKNHVKLLLNYMIFRFWSWLGKSPAHLEFHIFNNFERKN